MLNKKKSKKSSSKKENKEKIEEANQKSFILMSKDLIESVKKLREITGVGFKDCKAAIDETGGDIEKSIEILRKKEQQKLQTK